MWFLIFPLLQCTVTCGGGVQTRTVQCLRQGRPASGCLPHQKPAISRACNTNFCPAPEKKGKTCIFSGWGGLDHSNFYASAKKIFYSRSIWNINSFWCFPGQIQNCSAIPWLSALQHICEVQHLSFHKKPS